MPDTSLSSWQDLLPATLLDSAYRAGREAAWPRAQALDVIGLLEQQGRRVLGVDVWIPTQPGPTPVICDWAEAEAGTSAARSAAEFVDRFRWAMAGLDGEASAPYFNLTVD